MKVKIAFDYEENEYIAFVDQIPQISGFGSTEKDAILHLLYQAKQEIGFNQKIIESLINKIESDS